MTVIFVHHDCCLLCVIHVSVLCKEVLLCFTVGVGPGADEVQRPKHERQEQPVIAGKPAQLLSSQAKMFQQPLLKITF